jgi:hypothetical protein
LWGADRRLEACETPEAKDAGEHDLADVLRHAVARVEHGPSGFAVALW